MKRRYDILLFILGLLALGAGIGFYMLRADDTPSPEPEGGLEPADNPYASVKVTPMQVESANWPEAKAQPAGPKWIYDVFTPPKIFIDPETGDFIPEPPKPPEQEPPFGVYVASISQAPYRLQLEGYIEENPEKPEASLLLIHDVENSRTVRGRVGETYDKADFKVLDFVIDVERDESGNILSQNIYAEIRDLRSGETKRLDNNSVNYRDDVEVQIRSAEDPGVEIEVKQEGATFETPSGNYRVTEIDLENKAVTIKKRASEEWDARTRTFRPADGPSSPQNDSASTSPEPQSPESSGGAPESSAEDGDSSGAQDFDSLF